MAGLAARLPDPLVGLLPDPGGAVDLVGEHRPQALGDVVAPLGVQVDGVEHRAVDVILALLVGAVADPHRARALVALKVVERRLLEVLLALDAVHDLQRAVVVAIQSATYWMKSSASQSSPSACSPQSVKEASRIQQ